MNMKQRAKTRLLAAIIAAALMLSTAAPALAETFSAIVTSDEMTVYSDSKLNSAVTTLVKDTVVRVTSYSGKAAKITYSGGKGYARVSDMKSVDSVAAKAIVIESAKVYKTASTGAQSASVPQGTRVYVLSYSGDWARVEKDGVVGYMLLTALEAANSDWSLGAPTPSPTPRPTAAGVVKSSSLPVYKKASSSSGKLFTLKKNAKVNIVSWDSKWAYIEYEGKYGYCSVKGLAEATEAEDADALNAELVTVTATKLPVYKTASTKTKKLGTLKQGQQVYLLSVDGSWAYIMLDGNTGYAAKSGLSIAGNATPTPSPSPTPSLENATKGIVKSKKLTVYKTASTKADVQATLKKGDQVNVIQYNSSWAYIEFKGVYGFCALSGLTRTAEATPTPVAAPTDSAPAGLPSGYRSADFGATVVVSGAKLYAKASTSSSAVGVALGTEMHVSGYSKDLKWAVVDGSGSGYMLVDQLSRGTYDTVTGSGTAAQALLKALLTAGYYDGQVTAPVSSDMAVAAIKRFQAACGLSQTGTADQTLQRILYSGNAPVSDMLSMSLSNGSTGENVLRLQTRLYVLGYLSKSASLDSQYGATTASAVALFQKANGLTASGTADGATLKALYATGATGKPSSVAAADADTSSETFNSGSVSNDGVVTPPTKVTLSATYVTTMPASLKATISKFSTSLSSAQKLEFVIYTAQSNLTKPYVYGATGPNSYDCSGLTQSCFKKASVTLKRSAYSQGYDTTYTKISEISKLKRGDLVFFNTITDSDLCDHVGIYLGGYCFIHASSGGKKVVVSSLASGYYNRVFSWGRRIM